MKIFRTFQISLLALFSLQSLLGTIKIEKRLLPKTEISTPSHQFIALNESGEELGHIDFRYESKRGWICDFEVNQEMRRQGIGSLLFNAVIDDFKNKGYEYAAWTSYASAVKFYEAQGAHKTSKSMRIHDKRGKLVKSFDMQITFN